MSATWAAPVVVFLKGFCKACTEAPQKKTEERTCSNTTKKKNQRTKKTQKKNNLLDHTLEICCLVTIGTFPYDSNPCPWHGATASQTHSDLIPLQVRASLVFPFFCRIIVFLDPAYTTCQINHRCVTPANPTLKLQRTTLPSCRTKVARPMRQREWICCGGLAQ